MIIKFSLNNHILCNRRIRVRLCISGMYPLCAIVNRWISPSKTDEETQLPQNAGVCLARILDARFSSRDGSTLLV